jgi:hypothetical protein
MTGAGVSDKLLKAYDLLARLLASVAGGASE